MGRHKRLNAVRKSGKAQASKKLIDSSNELNQNNHNINEKRAQSGGGMDFFSLSFFFYLEV